MRPLGIVTFVVCSAATGYAVWASFTKRRPVDLMFGLIAPVTLIAALTGALLVFVPGFFG